MILALLTAPALGATIYVKPDGTGDQPNISLAVLVAAAGDTILLGDGIFTGSGNYNISISGKNLFLISESDDYNSCIIDYGGNVGIGITTTSALPFSVVRGIQFTGGSTSQGGGIYASVSNVNFENCLFYSNSASSNGGGVYLHNGTYNVHDCLFVTNYGRYGGGIYATGSTLDIRRCEFEACASESGAGISINGTCNTIITECLLVDNTAQNFAGGIFNTSPGTYVFYSTLVQNTAPSGGGGIYNYSTGYIGIDHTIIALSNSGGSYGGNTQVYNISCCDFFGNNGGDWNYPINGYFGINGNISIDPMFCDGYNPNDPWALDNDSPALTASCGPMGAKGYPGCGVVGTEESSWGNIKKMHQ
jgi:predicted outer membrane repeat protein